MTLSQVLAVIGDSEEPIELETLRAADAAAARHVLSGHGIAISGSDAHYAAFAEIALAVEPEIEDLQRKLESCTTCIEETPVIDVALDRWTPEIRAAYYFGVALALRVACLAGAR